MLCSSRGEEDQDRGERNSPAVSAGGAASGAQAEVSLQLTQEQIYVHTEAHRGPHATAGGHALKEAAAHGDPPLGAGSWQITNPW